MIYNIHEMFGAGVDTVNTSHLLAESIGIGNIEQDYFG